MGRSNRDNYPSQSPPRAAIPYQPPSQYNSDSDLDSPVFDPDDGNGNSSRFRFQDDRNTLYAAVAAAQYQYPTSIYGAHSVATRHDDHRIQDAQVPSPTSATSGSEHGAELGVGAHPSFGRNHVYFAMDPADQSGSRLPMPLSHSAGMQIPQPFQAEYSAYDDSYRTNMPAGGSRSLNSSSSPLADNPPTSKARVSKEISVVIACRPCRGRKIRCDSNRPSCNNCVRRKNECIYDAVPKRRGPDKRPGTRQRSCKKRPPADGTSPPPAKRKRKSAPSSSSAAEIDDDQQRLSSTDPISVSATDRSSAMRDPQEPSPPLRKRSSTSAASYSHSQPRPIQPHPHPSSSTSISAPLLRINTDFKYSQQSRSPRSENTSAYQPFTASTQSPYVQVKQQPHSPFLQPASAASPSLQHRKFPVPSTPAVESNQRNWWNQFLDQYPLNDVVADLSYLFSDTGHWLSFLNLPFFLDMLWNPEERLKIQPAFVLAGLAMAELMRSSDSERGAAGRARASWLRDNAQTALTIAMSGGNGDWIDASLAEAALILVLYETSAHPQYHHDRVAAALRVLDQILKAISVSTIDASDQDVPRFRNGDVPIVRVPYRPPALPTSPHHQYDYNDREGSRKCTCMPPGSPPPDTTQTWTLPLRWDPSWGAIEVRNEECRRLSWSALSLATSYLIQCVAFDREMPVLELSNPANYAILFPGEVSDRVSPAYCSQNSPSPKESVWALYCRSLLLWNFCNRLLTADSGPRSPHRIEIETDALQESWNEAQAIQDSLEIHVCNYETGVTYLCQEYIYNTRMSITQALRKMQGLSREISTTPGPLFNRKQTHQWIDYQARVIKRVKLATYQLGGPQGYQLTRRPFQVNWFLNQFSVCMQIWTHDTGLAEAVELGKDFLSVVDVLNALWPSKSNQNHTDLLRKQLLDACAVVGIPPPLPPTYATSLIRNSL
ncbi:Zn(2)-C6 fungal-type domain-containing protein [Favolaschia claudopus]|uniref:Zn(2)-C6 fungal-type domain-containing protein n=1 Tax=Favolaschia claudopus TaxID=2862362 RepID=A0AAW0D1M9_9AGAR